VQRLVEVYRYSANRMTVKRRKILEGFGKLVDGGEAHIHRSDGANPAWTPIVAAAA
jgi:hypothetical protein